MLSLRLRKMVDKLPTSVFDLVDEGGNVLGYAQVRHRVSAGVGVPKECASHIYYEINRDQRGWGYGKEILRLVLEEARKIGLRPIIITCNEDNVPSKRIIEVNGGSCVGSCELPSGKKLLRFEFE